jgi:AraC-like DNA-binding protein
MTTELISRLDVLQALLRAPLQVTSARMQAFPSGWQTADEVVVTHRLLEILEGAIDYTVEGTARRFEAGVQFFVPAWCRREWKTSKRGTGCHLSWCEFSSGPVNVPPALFWRQLGSTRSEAAVLTRMSALAKDEGNRAAELQQEGELKALLARFWPDARAEVVTEDRSMTAHVEVARAIAWLERHFAEPDALEAFYRTVTLSPNHFRLLFKKQTGETVQAVLARLRLRRARYLVQETAMPMKQIAAETGHADPLYFSLQYRRFWGRPATEDRKTGGVA